MANEVQIVINAVDKTKQALQSTEKGLGGLLKTAALASTAVIAFGAAAKKAFDLTARSESIGDANAALKSFAGSATNAQKIMNSVRVAADGMLSRFDATQASSRILSLGLAETAAQAGELTRIAVTLGDAFGKEAGPAVEDFTNMLVTGRLLGLKEYGISVSDVKLRATQLKYTTEGLSDAMLTQQAVLEVAREKLQELKDAGYEAGDATTQLTVAWADFKDAAAQSVGEGITPLIQGLTETLVAANDVNSAMTELNATLGHHGLFLDPLTNKWVAVRDAIGLAEDRSSEFQDGWIAGAPRVIAAAEETAESFQTIGDALDNIDINIGDKITDALKKARFAAQGGTAFQGILDSILGQPLSVENVENLTAQATIAYQAWAVEMGNLDLDDAASNIASALQVPVNQALEMLRSFQNTMLALNGMSIQTYMELIINGDTWVLNALKNGATGSPYGTLPGDRPNQPKKPKAPKQPGGYATGGILGNDGASIASVGENGEEGAIFDGKNWIIVPHQQWEMMKKLGIGASRGYASGGTLGGNNDGGYGGGWQSEKTYGNRYTSMAIANYGYVPGAPLGGSTFDLYRPSDLDSAGRPTRRVWGAGAVGAGSRPKESSGASAQQTAAVAAQAAQSAASGVGTAVATNASQQSASAINEFTKASAKQSAALIDKVDQLLRKTVSREDLKRAVADAVAESVR